MMFSICHWDIRLQDLRIESRASKVWETLKNKYYIVSPLRRKKIRLCCDQLNMLVPFCHSDSDKVSTLLWTTAFLRYINKTYGDTFKEVFQPQSYWCKAFWLDHPVTKLCETVNAVPLSARVMSTAADFCYSYVVSYLLLRSFVCLSFIYTAHLKRTSW